ncbi:MAG: glycosyltransferase family 2 protein [Nitrospiraceae bacterium]|nr:glycosyltransferase family 2 protein [Nitrospiraceae bacterium]
MFSIIVPVYNEEENIPELCRRLTSVMEALCAVATGSPDRYEVILVDDGSRDQTWPLIEEFHRKDKRIKGVSFSRNFGHHIAITAGLDHAKGQTIVLMDGDLQDRPEEIPGLWQRLQEGYDLIYGIRKVKKDTIAKRLNSFLFWWFLNRFSGVAIPRDQTLLRIFDRKILEVLTSMRERSRFIHGMMAWTGFRIALHEVEHAPRARGVSKYNMIKLFRLAFNAITSFSTFPLRLATYLGLMSSGVGFFYALYFVYKKIFMDIPVPGFASTIVAVMVMGGVQLLMLGIIGEYLGRVYQEVQARPIYVLKEQLLD